MSKLTTGWVAGVSMTVAVVVAGCTNGDPQAASGTGTTTAPASATTQPAAIPVAATRPSTFKAYRDQLRVKAISAGISPTVFDTAFAGVKPSKRVIELDRKQPEFSRPIWKYLDTAVSNARVSTGKSKAARMAQTLAGIESRYGVERNIILAVWGMESNFGSNFGNFPVIRSFATLAYDGRRKRFAEEQVLAALKILQSGDITADRMIGSWAGAMGHTQFIPTSFLTYAVDYTGDGKRDIWAPDAADALASTANYLSRFGWTKGAPVMQEVTLPQGFDYALADGKTRRATSAWQALGVTGVGGSFPASDNVALIVPAGARGPAFAIYSNFGVIKRYNNATSYAMGVAHLADRIGGGSTFEGAWPRDDRTLSRTEKRELQGKLTALGYDTKGIDGKIGPNSRAAVRRFQQAQGLIPDGYVSSRLLDQVRKASG